jgi:hypothetical protein
MIRTKELEKKQIKSDLINSNNKISEVKKELQEQINKDKEEREQLQQEMDRKTKKFISELKNKWDNEKIINEQLKEKDIELIKQEQKMKDILNKHKVELNELNKEIELLQKDKKIM